MIVRRSTIEVISSSEGVIIKGLPISLQNFSSLLPVNFSGNYRLSSESFYIENRKSDSENLSFAGLILLNFLRKLRIFLEVHRRQDSVHCTWTGIPAGLGEPCFDKLQAVLCKELLMIPSALSFEIGSGFGGVGMKGSEHNDVFVKDGDSIKASSNWSGGVLGGISTGSPLEFRVGFEEMTEEVEGLVSSVSAAVILDFLMVQKVRKHRVG